MLNLRPQTRILEVQCLGLVMGPSLGSARARPGPAFFWKAQARQFEKGPGSTQALARLFEKGPENCCFYVVKIRGSSRLGLDFFRRA